MKPAEPILLIKALTWGRDSHGLFDYESELVYKDRISLQDSALLFRNENSIISSPLHSALTDPPALLKVQKTQTGFQLTPETGEMWTVIDCNRKKSSSKGCRLQTNDTVKLGRVKFLVKEICGYGEADSVPQMNVFQNSDLGDQHVCRICLAGEEENDPLISPCNCGGTMKFIHLSCFKKWIESKTTKKIGGNSLSYFVKSLTCEISRCPVPAQLMVHGQEVSLLEINSVLPPYIILESSVSDKNEYSLHLISLSSKNGVKLGRGHDSDIRISDISVSRCHAAIRFEDGEFFLEDNSSKFGTLIENKEIMVSKAQPSVCVQVGRTLFVIMLSTQENDISIDETDEEQEPNDHISATINH